MSSVRFLGPSTSTFMGQWVLGQESASRIVWLPAWSWSRMPQDHRAQPLNCTQGQGNKAGEQLLMPSHGPSPDRCDEAEVSPGLHGVHR